MSFKENDIRPNNLMELKKPALDHDIKFLQDRIPSFVSTNCIACISENHALWAVKNLFSYRKCNDCQTIFMSPRPDENTLGEFYKQSQNYAFWNKYIFPATDVIRKQKIFIPRAENTIAICEKYGVTGGTLLEVGAAFGTFCEAVREKNFFQRIVAVEPTPSLAQTCRQKGIETFEQTIEELTFPKGGADVVASFEVIEHLGDPGKFLQLSVEVLNKGGLFICTCPSGTGLGTVVLKEKAKVVDHEHINYFNPLSLPILLRRHGLEVIDVSTPGELDVDLLKNDYEQNPELFEGQHFFRYLFEKSSPEDLFDFQEFIKKILMSSHLWVVARKI